MGFPSDSVRISVVANYHICIVINITVANVFLVKFCKSVQSLTIIMFFLILNVGMEYIKGLLLVSCWCYLEHSHFRKHFTAHNICIPPYIQGHEYLWSVFLKIYLVKVSTQ